MCPGMQLIRGEEGGAAYPTPDPFGFTARDEQDSSFKLFPDLIAGWGGVPFHWILNPLAWACLILPPPYIYLTRRELLI